MNQEQQQRIEQRLRSLEDGELRAIVVLLVADHTPEFVALARAELARRNLAVPTPEAYWTELPHEWLAGVGFCYRCWSDTTDESPGNTATVNLIGTALTGEEERCEVCGSVIKTKHFWLILPLIPLGRFRVIRCGDGRYLGRRLRRDRAASGSD
jgi:hypothetical protein